MKKEKLEKKEKVVKGSKVKKSPKMKKFYWKYIFSSMKHDVSRIIAITSIVALGVGFLVGLLSTTPDLFKTMDSYYDAARFADVTIRSTAPFAPDTGEKIKEALPDSDIDQIVLTQEIESYVEINGNKVLSRITTREMNDRQQLDLLTLVDGEWPDQPDECVMLVSNQSTVPYQIDQQIRFMDPFAPKETPREVRATIVGMVRDPNYITYQAEQSFLTGGTIKSYIYFDAHYATTPLFYTNAYVKFGATTEMDSFSKEYEKYIDSKITELSFISKDLAEAQIEALKQTMYEQAEIIVKEEVKQAILDFAADSGLPIDEAKVNELLESEFIKTIIKNKTDEAVAELLKGNSPTWYILNRDAVRSAYVFKADALKVQTIATIFPPFFFLIALLVCLSSMSRIITKDRQMIGTFKALGFTKGRISLKYIIYGLMSSFIGSAIGVGLGLFVLPAAMMFVYSSIYYFQTMQFVFTAWYAIGFSLLMMGMIIAVVLGVVFSNLKEPAAQLMLGGKAPKAGKKILIERIPFLWKHLKFKWKSTFRNIFRFKKNLFMMIIGVGGCTGLLLTGFGIKDSFSVISNDQYQDIIKYDAVVTTTEQGMDPTLIFEDEEQYSSVTYMHGTCHGAEDVQVEIFGSDRSLTDYVGFFDLDGDNLQFDVNSIIITQQLSEILNKKVGDVMQVTSDNGVRNLTVSGICRNYVSNYIYIGAARFQEIFEYSPSNENNNAFLVRFNDLSIDEIAERLETYPNKNGVKAVISTTETRQTYDAIVSNLGMIVFLITLLSGALAAIVIYNLTDININERIREIATLRVCGYKRGEVLMYILREILMMSLLGILIGLGLGVFLHHFIIVNISSVGIFFLRKIHWSSYLITFAIATAFVVGISFCFYPKIKKVSMTESLKSVD